MDGSTDSRLSASSAQNEPASEQLQEWMREQEILKSRLILHDDFSWTLPPKPSDTTASSKAGSSLVEDGNWLRYIGGVDLSFSKSDSLTALGALIVLDMHSMKVVYEDFDMVQLEMPYIPGFLAFRESPVLLNLLKKIGNSAKTPYPQLLMVDGNGILHPRGFGLASHLGVLADIPTIGVGKNLHHVDGLSDAEVRLEVSKSNLSAGDTVPLIGRSGTTWGVAFKSHEGSTKPIFISIGHRISLETATAVVQRCCQYRVPEPVRQVPPHNLSSVISSASCLGMYISESFAMSVFSCWRPSTLPWEVNWSVQSADLLMMFSVHLVYITTLAAEEKS